MKKISVLFLLLMLFDLSFSEQKLKVAYLVTRGREDMFYRSVIYFAEEAAKQLDIELDVYDADDNQLKMRNVAKDILERKYDALMFVNLKKIGIEILELAENAKIPVLVENSGIINENAGKPREKFKYWIGELLPNDEQAGYLLAEELFKYAEKRESKEFVAIQGLLATGSSLERVNGLYRALDEYPDFKMRQLVAAFWERERAKEIFINLKRRYNDITFAWAASDGMGLGVVDACKEKEVESDQKILTGGVDWSREGIQAVKEGDFVASAGGHFMEGAWGLILIHDYFKGIDFADESTELRSGMSLITRENIEDYEIVLNSKNWDKIDFKYFSKFYNKELNHYIFNPEIVVEQLNKKIE